MAHLELKQGDVVQLKSGGPKMTVRSVSQGNPGVGLLAEVVWFGSGDKEEHSQYPVDELERVSDDEA